MREDVVRGDTNTARTRPLLAPWLARLWLVAAWLFIAFASGLLGIVGYIAQRLVVAMSECIPTCPSREVDGTPFLVFVGVSLTAFVMTTLVCVFPRRPMYVISAVASLILLASILAVRIRLRAYGLDPGLIFGGMALAASLVAWWQAPASTAAADPTAADPSPPSG